MDLGNYSIAKTIEIIASPRLEFGCSVFVLLDVLRRLNLTETRGVEAAKRGGTSDPLSSGRLRVAEMLSEECHWCCVIQSRKHSPTCVKHPESSRKRDHELQKGGVSSSYFHLIRHCGLLRSLAHSKLVPSIHPSTYTVAFYRSASDSTTSPHQPTSYPPQPRSRNLSTGAIHNAVSYRIGLDQPLPFNGADSPFPRTISEAVLTIGSQFSEYELDVILSAPQGT